MAETFDGPWIWVAGALCTCLIGFIGWWGRRQTGINDRQDKTLARHDATLATLTERIDSIGEDVHWIRKTLEH